MNEYEKKLFERVLAAFQKYGFFEHIVSVVLTGSFGRNEASYENSVLKSDVEIALIYKTNADKAFLLSRFQKLCSEFDEDLNLMPISEKRVRSASNFNNSVFSQKKKTVFTYDLYNGSRTIWGEKLIEQKKISLSELDLFEAKRLVANRIAEYTYLKNNVPDADLCVWRGKIVLALASAFLILDGSYCSSYHGQYKTIEQKKTQVEKILGKGFFELYTAAFRYLRANGDKFLQNEKEILPFVLKINEKLDRIIRVKTNSFSRKLKYFVKYARCGFGFGLFGFENKILSAVINEFSSESKDIESTAAVWHKVLY